MRRVYIIERDVRGWFAVVPNQSRIVRLAKLLPRRWVWMESARVGNDTSFTKLCWWTF